MSTFLDEKKYWIFFLNTTFNKKVKGSIKIDCLINFGLSIHNDCYFVPKSKSKHERF